MIEMRELDRPGTLADAQATLAGMMGLDARQLELAVHWADLHHPDSLPAPVDDWEMRRRQLDGSYAVQPGGEGTPEILASCPAELGLVLQTSAGGSKHLMADALDLRHRLRSLWADVLGGRVRGWKARKVAQSTRHLPLAVVRRVDADLAGLIPTLSWSRFETVLDATLMRADPVGARFTEAEAASRRFVSLGRDGGRGLKTLIARGEVLDILTFLAAVNRIADLLGVDGDESSVPVRRSKAVGILAQPDRALALLTAHAHDTDQHDTEPTVASPDEPEPDEPEPDEPEADEPERDEPGSRSIDLTGPVPAAGQTPGVRVQLYVHLTDGALSGPDSVAVCRVEGVGPVTAATVRTWLQRPDVRVTVRPVTVPGDAMPVDGYEIPASVREAVLLRNPASAYPWSGCTDRNAFQLDHVTAYRLRSRGGPPGQTAPGNLAPLTQTEHQRKTSGQWRERAPAPGVCLWRSPHGWVSLVTNQGTFPLGNGPTAQAIWCATAPQPAARAEPAGHAA